MNTGSPDMLYPFVFAALSDAEAISLRLEMLYVDARLEGQIYVMLGAMDRPQDYPPTVHGYMSEKLPFFDVDDDLPRRPANTVPRPR